MELYFGFGYLSTGFHLRKYKMNFKKGGKKQLQTILFIFFYKITIFEKQFDNKEFIERI